MADQIPSANRQVLVTVVQMRTSVPLPAARREYYAFVMTAARLDALRSLLAAATAGLDRGVAVECKHFFSGAAAYANGRIFMTATSVGVALKLPPQARAALARRGAKPLRYFPQGPIKKDYVIVPDGMALDAGALAPWVAKSVLFALTLPKPRRASERVRSGR